MKALFSTLDENSNGNIEESEFSILSGNSSEFEKVYCLIFYAKY